MERNGRSSGGFGMTMDDYGHLFETHNTDHINQSVFPVIYWKCKTLDPTYIKNISNHDEDGLLRIYPIGDQETQVNHPEQSGCVSGACGINFNGGNILGEHYKNTVWEADVVLNLLHVDLLSDKGCVKVANRLFCRVMIFLPAVIVRSDQSIWLPGQMNSVCDRHTSGCDRTS